MGSHQIRAVGVLIEEGQLLLVQQQVNANRGWSLPGGRVEAGETLEEAVVREMKEETGLNVSIERLLYVADKPENNLLHITFQLRRDGGEIQLPTNEFDENPIADVRFVAIDQLGEHGFSKTWQELVANGLSTAPSYAGLKQNIGL